MLRSLVVLAILVPGFFMALKNRYAALLLYLWLAFFRPQDWLWIDIASLRLSLVIGAVLLVPSVASGIWPDVKHPLSLGGLLFLGLALIAQIGAVNPPVGWQWIDFLSRLVLVCLIAVPLMTTPQRLLGVVAVIAGSLGFHASKAGLMSLVHGGDRFEDGLAGAFIDNNGYALATVMIMPMLLALSENLEQLLPGARPLWLKWLRRGLRTSMLLCAFTVVSTFSRGGFLGMVAATIVYVALHRQRVRLALALSALTAVVLTFAPIPDGYTERLQTIQNYEEIGEKSAMSRPHFWQVAVSMANARTFGVGLRNFESAYNDFDFSNGLYGRSRSVHSSHFQVLAELGYLGAAVWMGQFAYAFIVAFRIRARSRLPDVSASDARLLESLANALMVSMVGFLVGGSFIALALNDVTWITFAMVVALDRLASRLCAGAATIRPNLSAERAGPIRLRPVAAAALAHVRRRAGRPMGDEVASIRRTLLPWRPTDAYRATGHPSEDFSRLASRYVRRHRTGT